MYSASLPTLCHGCSEPLSPKSSSARRLQDIIGEIVRRTERTALTDGEAEPYAERIEQILEE